MRKDLMCPFLFIVEAYDIIKSGDDIQPRLDINCYEEDCAIWDIERECCSLNTKPRVINIGRQEVS